MYGIESSSNSEQLCFRGGGRFSTKNIFCRKFDETSFCTGPALISVFVHELEPFFDFAHTNALTLVKISGLSQTLIRSSSGTKADIAKRFSDLESGGSH